MCRRASPGRRTGQPFLSRPTAVNAIGEMDKLGERSRQPLRCSQTLAQGHLVDNLKPSFDGLRPATPWSLR